VIITSVKDFGIGIAAKHHANIFDKFYRVNETKKQTYPGLGIGLYITSEIIKRHGGNIWVNSNEGEETSFIFTLPIYEN
jgi:signal transduction histidine kinase